MQPSSPALSLNSLDWVFITIVPVVAYFLGRFWKSKDPRPKDYVEFCLARRKLNDWNFLSAFFGANLVFTAIFLVVTNEAARRGWWVLAIPIGFVLGIVLLWLFYGRLTTFFDEGLTLHAAFAHIFGSPFLQRICAIWTIIAFVGLVSVEFYGAILLLRWVGTPFIWNTTIALILAGICTAFTVSGGLRGVSRTDIFLDIVSLGGIGVFCWYLFRNGASDSISSIGATLARPSSVSFPSTEENIVFALAALVLFIPMPICALDTWQRGVAWKQQDRSVAPLLFLGAFAILCATSVAIAAGFHAVTTGWAPGNNQALEHVLSLLGGTGWWPGAKGLIVAGFIAAVFSTADELLNCSAYALMSDVFRVPRGDDNGTKERHIKSVKFYTAVFGLIAAVLSVSYFVSEQRKFLRIVDVFNAFAATQVVFFLPLLFALKKNKKLAANYSTTANVSMILSFCAAVITAFVGAFFMIGQEAKDLLDGMPLVAFMVGLFCWSFSLTKSFVKRHSRRKPAA